MASGSQKLYYIKTPGSVNNGYRYEVKLIGLVLVRALKRGESFFLAASVDKAWLWDDIVIRMKVNNEYLTCFVQLKHTVKKITINELKKKDKGFSMESYLKAYQAIQTVLSSNDKPFLFQDSSLKNCRFVLYTNARVSDADTAMMDVTERTDCMDNNVKELLKTESTDNRMFKLRTIVDDDLNLIFNSDEGQDFLKKLKIFSNQPNMENLDEWIASALQGYYNNMSHDEAMLLVPTFIEDIEKWRMKNEKIYTNNVKQERSCILTENDVILKNAHSKCVVRDISMKHQKEIRSLLLINTHLPSLKRKLSERFKLLTIVYEAEEKQLGYRRVLKVMDDLLVPFIFLTMDSWFQHHQEVIYVWSTTNKHHLIILGDTVRNDDNIYNEIYEVLTNNPNKRCLLVDQVENSMARDLNTKLPANMHELYVDCLQ